MTQEQWTKKQHFIPQMILKNFTPINSSSDKPMMIYQYDKIKKCERIAPIKDVCKKDNLYELRDNNGNIIKEYRNKIERNLSKWELEWDITIQKILKDEPLDEKDYEKLYVLIVFQTLRMPLSLEFTKNFIQKQKPSFSNQESDKYAKICSLFIDPSLPEEANWPFYGLAEKLVSKKLYILKSKIPLVLNGKEPVLFLRSFEIKDSLMSTVFFPIATSICLRLSNICDGEDTDPAIKEIDSECANFINAQNFQNESEFVYRSCSIKKDLALYEDKGEKE